MIRYSEIEKTGALITRKCKMSFWSLLVLVLSLLAPCQTHGIILPKKYLVGNNKHDKSIISLLYWMHKHVCSASFALPVTYSSFYIIACYYPCCTEYLGSENVCLKQHKHLSFKRCPFEHSIKHKTPQPILQEAKLLLLTTRNVTTPRGKKMPAWLGFH